ncbi:MAG: polysaccharide deacetylase family protein [Clostridia bacterium]|nr:polysaccharide deacetylase family protein [Clostridia bacterium]
MKRFTSILICAAVIFSCASCAYTKRGQAKDNAAATTGKKTYSTYTGFKPLDEVSYKVSDPGNTAGLSNKAVEHSYGVARDGKPHEISVQSEKYFEDNGFKAVTYDNKTVEKVLYLTFDCGYENGYTEKILDVLKEKNVKAAFFCTLDDIKSVPELIARIIKDGHIVGNHSATHPSFPSLSREDMALEIEKCENYLRKSFGYAPNFFRFPKGEYSANALELVGSLGYTSVFWSLSYSDWDTDNQKGGDYAFEKVTSRLHPGAVILLHSVSADNAAALGRIIDYAENAGYEFRPLDSLPAISQNNYSTTEK